jgi:hypothetical protein
MIVRVKRIDVEFIDADSGQRIGHSKVPLGDLPESFAHNTRFTIKDDQYTVVGADPVHAEDFSRTGKLVLTLRPIRYIDPRRLLYTVPTLSDDTFSVTDHRVGPDEDYLSMRDDDWRQVELVSIEYVEDIEEEFNDIRQIVEKESVAGAITGFRKLHVRKRIPSPILSSISVPELRAALVEMTKRRGIVDRSSRRVVDGGFAYLGPHLSVYGIESGGRIAVIGLDPGGSGGRQLGVEFADFMASQRLYLVDWCRVLRVAGA